MKRSDKRTAYPRKWTCSLDPLQLWTSLLLSQERLSINWNASHTRTGNRPTVVLKTMTTFC